MTKMNILFLDIETTGLDPTVHKILEIGAALYVDYASLKEKGGLPVGDTFSEKIHYYTPIDIDLGALNVNKVKLADIEGRANTPDAVLKKFVDWLLAMKEKYGEFVVCGQNVDFDLAFIEAGLNELGIENLKAIAGYRKLDIAGVGLFLKLAGYLPDEVKPSSDGLAKHFGLSTEGSHQAMPDVRLSEETLAKMLELVKKRLVANDIPPMVL